MIIITYITHSAGYFNVLQKQCKKLNLNLKILGFGEKWIGFFQRFIAIYNYIKTLDDTEIILIIDGFDTIPLENEEMILNKYKSFNKPIVWGVENDYDTNYLRMVALILSTNISYGNVDGVMLNGGTYIGEVKYIKIIYEYIFKNYDTNNLTLDDQVIINKIGNETWFKEIVSFDLNSILFCNLGISTSSLYFKNNIIFYKNIAPSILSCPGKTSVNKIVKELGYKEDVIVEYDNFVSEENILLLIIIILLILICIIKIILNK